MRRKTVTTAVTKHWLGNPAMTPSKIFEVGRRSSINILVSGSGLQGFEVYMHEVDKNVKTYC